MLDIITDHFGGKEYKIFVSYSFKDTQNLEEFLNEIEKGTGVRFILAEKEFLPANEGGIPEKVSMLIDKCDAVMIVISKDAYKSNWVQQEIGYAMKTKKPIIPMIEVTKEKKQLGFLSDKDTVVYKGFKRISEVQTKLVTIIKDLIQKKRQGIKSNIKFALFIGAGLFISSFFPDEEDYNKLT